MKWKIYGYYRHHACILYAYTSLFYKHSLKSCFVLFLSKLMTHLKPKQKQLFSNEVLSSFVELIKKSRATQDLFFEWIKNHNSSLWKNHNSSLWNSIFWLTVWQSKSWKNRWLLEFALYHNEFDELDGCILNDIIKSKECEF